MSKISNSIQKWIKSPERFVKNPSLLSSKGLSDNIPECRLKIQSLKCIKKNEFSADEIRIYMFWLCNNNSIEGIISSGHDYKRTGEVFELNLDIPLKQENSNKVFCILIYEEDAPLLLDPHDPIGLVTFHQNQGIAVHEGDFRKTEDPRVYSFLYNDVRELELDAGSDGHYQLSIKIITDEN